MLDSHHRLQGPAQIREIRKEWRFATAADKVVAEPAQQPQQPLHFAQWNHSHAQNEQNEIAWNTMGAANSIEMLLINIVMEANV